MQIFVDSAARSDIEAALATGYIYGVTTNPTLLQRAGIRAAEVPQLARWALGLGAQQIHLQVYSDQVKPMVQEAHALFDEIDPARVAVKIPATPAGYTAAALLSRQGVRVTLTAVYTLAQAVLAQSVGAAYAAIYLGRMRDSGIEALNLVERMQRTLAVQGANVKIVAASLRAPADLEALAELGVPMATLPPAVLHRLLESSHTAQAATTFCEAACTLQ